eukprot:IDg12559t1
MLSERQQKVLINRVNADVDLPLVNEDFEHRVIQKVVTKVAPLVEPALRNFLPTPYVDCMKIALCEEIPIVERRLQIATILRGEIAEPLSRELNERCDASLVPERLEGVLFKAISNKFVDEFVEWTVSEIDERMQASLDKSRGISAPEDEAAE